MVWRSNLNRGDWRLHVSDIFQNLAPATPQERGKLSSLVEGCPCNHLAKPRRLTFGLVSRSPAKLENPAQIVRISPFAHG